MANAATMPLGGYGTRHTNQWSMLVALPPPGKCSRSPEDAMVVVVVVAVMQNH